MQVVGGLAPEILHEESAPYVPQIIPDDFGDERNKGILDKFPSGCGR